MKQKRLIRIYLLLAAALLWHCTAMAQEGFYLTGFSTRDGLSHNNVRYVAQDSTGYLWFSTWDGLSRYDGYTFKNYYHNPDDESTIPYFSLLKIVVDRYNNVWIQSEGRTISRYDRANDCFIRENADPDLTQHQDIAVDHEGRLWKCNVLSGIARYDYGRQKFVPVNSVWEDREAMFPSLARSFYYTFDKHGIPWFVFYDGIQIFYCKGTMEGDHTLCFDKKSTGLSEEQIREFTSVPWLDMEVLFSDNGTTWLSAQTGLYRVNEKNGLWEKKLPPYTAEEVSGISHQARIIDSETIIYELTAEEPHEIRIPHGHYIQSLLTDNKGVIWYSCVKGSGEGTGVTRAIPVHGFFKHHLPGEDQLSNTDAYFAVIRDRYGTIWASPRNLNHLYWIKPDRQIIRCNYLSEDLQRRAYHPRSFLEDENGMWIGYYYDMLVRYDYESGKFSKITAPFRGRLTHTWGFKHLQPGENKIIGAGDYGFMLVDTQTRKVTRIPYSHGLTSVFAMEKDSAGHFWLGSSMSRLFHFDENLEFIEEHRITSGGFNVEDMAFSDDGSIWITLLGGGLCHYFPETRKSKVYTTADGLSNNTCYEIIRDEEGYLWISTNQGISRFSSRTGKFRIFGPSDGLKIEEFNSDAAWLAPDGEMFFGGMGGVVSFNPARLVETDLHSTEVPLLINRILANGVEQHFPKAVCEMDSIVLDKGVTDLQISFGALDFRYPNKVRYRYRLTGIKHTWTETDHRNRIINYGNLSPGKYLLTIEATDREGEWISKKSLWIKILPHYYQTWGFRFFIIGLTILLIGYFLYNYNRQIRLKALQKQDELRLESLRSQMNPHFIFNSLNSINYFISRNDRRSANNYIADFSRLVRSILENSSQEYVPFTTEMESIRSYMKLEHLRFGNKFEYSIRVEEGLENASTHIYPGLVQPFLENAIWHGVRGLEERKGTIILEFTKSDPGLIKCRIEDDGIGRTLTLLRKSTIPGKSSRGIGIVMERLRIINNLRNTNYSVTITDKFSDRDETGTVVVLDIPVKP